MLWRNFSAGEGVLLIVGLNPSTADENTNDPTIRRCINFARDWGFRTLLVGNLFSYRATRPEDLRKSDSPVVPENDLWLMQASKMANLTLAAWGNNGLWKTRHRDVAQILQSPKCLGLTKTGAPRHPLYVLASQQPVDYSVQGEFHDH
ncbi:MAG: DUF1643 domain-containing protein [Arenicella sp.]|nr:DUF1643 domain-containing protein [Arenicella sp.]